MTKWSWESSRKHLEARNKQERCASTLRALEELARSPLTKDYKSMVILYSLNIFKNDDSELIEISSDQGRYYVSSIERESFKPKRTVITGLHSLPELVHRWLSNHLK